ncbi:MFS transporter [Halalkalibacillus halophilus]|uniref:MFS transporter n=1 Tax=Halalkalibacillus halophilus TaxID=392827 RepID=UPI00040AC093|nr:MFS transporter [Halalkalibacillus halophilus]
MSFKRIPDISDHEKKNLTLLLTIGLLYTLGIYLSSIFVNIFLWKQTSSIQVVALYNLFVVTSQMFVYFIFGSWAKRVDRVVILRIGILFISIFFMTVLLLGDYASNYNMMLGAILGIGYGFFWLAFNVLTFEVTEPYSRDLFNSNLGKLQSFSGMVGPLSAGLIIRYAENSGGYLIIFFISFMLFIAAIVTSFFMERRKVNGKYAIFKASKEIRIEKKWRLLLVGHFSQGLREGVFLFLVGLLVYIGTENELVVGTYNFIYALTSLVAYQYVSKIVHPDNRFYFIFAGTVGLYGSIFILIQANSSIEFFIYAAIIGLTFPLFFAPYMSISYDVIGKLNYARELRIEYVILREIFLNFGRVMSIGFFLIGVLYLPIMQWVNITLIILGSGYLFTAICIYLIRRRLSRN